MATNIPQSNYQSPQNSDINIVDTYKDYITGANTPNDNDSSSVGIDDIRAVINVGILGTKTTNLLTSLNISPTSQNITPPPTPNTTTPVVRAQESRCHAFFRMIGFPVIASDYSYYNPGLDSIKETDSSGNPISRKITLSIKIDIASKVSPQFESISQARETWVSSTGKIFAIPTSVEAGVLALSSGTYSGPNITNIRTFSAPFTKNIDSDPFDFAITDQSYSTNQFSLVGNQFIPFLSYQDNSGNTLTTNGTNNPIFQQHQHIILPFMVDPRIDFSTWSNDSATAVGTCRRVAVPFVPDATFLKAGSTSTALRPFIEKVITDRINQSNNTTSSGLLGTNYVQYVQNIKSFQTIQIGGTSLSSIFSNSAYSSDQQESLIEFIYNTQALIYKLVESIHKVQAAQAKYYWLPQPNTSGPEAGCDIRDVPFTTQSFGLLTPDDTNIILNQLQVFFSNLNSLVAAPTSMPNKGGFAFSSPIKTFNNSTSNASGNLSANTMDKLAKQRNNDLSKASDALQVIEMIMGEFSGLGLGDILVITQALYIINIEDLLGFLDTDAYSRATDSLGELPAQNDIKTAMQNYANTVYGLYQIMDKSFQDISGNNLNQ
jgi:hypothetical protein